MNMIKSSTIEAKKLNHFELRLKQTAVYQEADTLQSGAATLQLSAEIWIDAQMLDEPHTVSVNAVLRSLAKVNSPDGGGRWDFVFTCACGNPSCACIYEGVGALRGEESIDWVLRRPQANRFGTGVLAFKQWCETSQWQGYRFDVDQANAELIRFLDEVAVVINTSDMPIANESQVLIWFEDDPRLLPTSQSSDQVGDAA